MIRFLLLIPGLLGAFAITTVYNTFNSADLAREIEAGTAILTGWGVFFVASIAMPMLLRAESEVEKMLENAGVSADHAAMRAARHVEKSKAHVSSMREALSGRSESLRDAFNALSAKLEPLFEDMITSPDTASRADDLTRRILPRLASAVQNYCAYAARGDGVVDTEEARARLINAFENAGAAAERARRDALEMSEIDVTASLDVLETTLSHPR